MARTRFSIASFNLYNLNRPGESIYSDADGWSSEQYNMKIAWTGRTLRSLDADVWGFQELWHAQALEEAFCASGKRSEFTLLVPEGHAGQRIVCAGAVRSEYLVDEPEWITDFPEAFRLESKGDDPQTPAISVTLDAFSRPVLHFVIRPRREGKPIHVFVCHFKSKAPTQIWREGWYDKETYSKHSVAIGAGLSTIRRTAEATALRMIITGYVQGSDTPVVVLGDLNDGIHSNTLNVVTGQPNYLLSGLSKGGSDRGLYSAATLQQLRSERDVYYSHIHQNRMEILDHILVSEEFYDNSRDRIWAFRGMEVMNDHLHRGDHKETGTGDHGIIMASFEYRPVN